MTTFKHLSNDQLSYIAGFLDGDGCINAQIVRRPDYRLGFQIRVSVTFYQKTSRYWFLVWLQKQLQCGTLRQRPDGVSELALGGIQTIQPFLLRISKFLILKRRQARLVGEICHKLSKNQSPQDFVQCCYMVDHIENLNDSKKRSINAEVVKKHLAVDN